MTTENSDSQKANGKNALEWVVFAASIVLISLLLVYMGIQAATHKSEPARLKITLGTPSRSESAFTVPVFVENLGQTTASNVQIEVAAPNETSGFTLDYVPREGQSQGFVTFKKDFEKEQLKARVVGYTD